jgi:hypothetical protein
MVGHDGEVIDISATTVMTAQDVANEPAGPSIRRTMPSTSRQSASDGSMSRASMGLISRSNLQRSSGRTSDIARDPPAAPGVMGIRSQRPCRERERLAFSRVLSPIVGGHHWRSR